MDHGKEINTLEQNGMLKVMIETQEAVITTDDVEILSEDIPGWLVGEGRLTVALDNTSLLSCRRRVLPVNW